MNGIHTLINTGWDDYELIDSGNGEKLERFGKFTLVRPDPQLIWKPTLPREAWEKADALFTRITEDKGTWRNTMPEKWEMHYKNLTFICKLSPFKHTGVFPEQSLHWDFIMESIEKANRETTILNLFGYTGIASLAAAAAGAKVTHIDASYPAIGWGRENQALSHLEDKPIRWILEDCVRFVQREIKRGASYDGIIMDPPKFGHGPKGERWQFEDMFGKLMQLTTQILSPDPIFFLVNAYAISASSIMLGNVLSDHLSKYPGTIESGELILKQTAGNRLVSTGIYAKWSK